MTAAWEVLRAPLGGRLQVATVESRVVEELRVVAGRLPAVSNATLFDAWHQAGGYVARAVLIAAERAQPFEIRASRLRIEASDGALERLLGTAPASSASGRATNLPPPGVSCACRNVASATVEAARHAGWTSVDAAKRRTKAAFGECQGRRCVPVIARQLGLAPDDARATITPRPPLVPVPASVLAAFAAR